ncbi:hypothetical protein HDA41_003720 [Streptomyces caelestis]|uniref:Uncharacterized protein n=1 Tax=Streptomyces caelestis TaxID=36816 RepID=A0A7W9H5N0_9ACTN|nr:hypothetical protein [Streptomyces caelestis]
MSTRHLVSFGCRSGLAAPSSNSRASASSRSATLKQQCSCWGTSWSGQLGAR